MGGDAERALDALLRRVGEERASDLHLSSGEPPLLRVDGRLHRLKEEEALSAVQVDAFLEVLVGVGARGAPGAFDRIAAEGAIDFTTDHGELGRFRVNAYRHERGPALALRAVPRRPPSLEALGLPKVVRQLCDLERGLVLVTGPTGSGKSTTLASMLDVINAEREAHVLTIEDPIEFLHAPRRCLVSQREVGRHAPSFAAALRSALREDPDVILVGEMRDLETVALALTAAETGHLVLATLHARSAAKTVDRIVDVFPSDQQRHVRSMLAESLEGVLAQSLVERAGGGRVAAVEVLLGAPSVRNLIREGKAHQLPSVMQTSVRSGMQTLTQALSDLHRRGLIESGVVPAGAVVGEADGG